MAYYESVMIARQDISASQVETLADSYVDIIKENGGTVSKKEHWGLRTLAYRIKKNRKGHYVLFNIDAPAAAVQEMERNMRLNEDVLRYLTVKTDALEEGPSVMMQRRSGRDDRGRRPYAPRPPVAQPEAPAPAPEASAAKAEAPAAEAGEGGGEE